MTLGAGLFVIVAHMVSTNMKPDKLELKEYKLVCKEILYFYETDGYPHPGIYMKTGKNFLTNHNNSAMLEADVKEQCKR
jgi:hypothetical protein